jgi:hypothetical protein
MSANAVESVLTRMMSDTSFAEQMFTQPESALNGFDLTAEEISALKSMPREEFHRIASATPEERRSFGGGYWSG